jgi:DnaJ-class molecular chaperone
MKDIALNKIIVPHPDGELLLGFPDEVDTSKSLRVKTKGFRQNQLGDLYIKLFFKQRRVSE